ncbi:MAG: hypothetical protein P1U36_03625 [Legionellaceae bacterium]|nr:hypothetical protein [Legionellaceae bacterium]
MIKIDFLGKDGSYTLLSKVVEHVATIKKLEDALGAVVGNDGEPSDPNKTAAYIAGHMRSAVSLSQSLEQEIYKTQVSVLSHMSPDVRKTLADKIDAMFKQVSKLDFDEINIVDQTSHDAACKLLKMLEAYQAIFPTQIDQHLKGAQKALSAKMDAYELHMRAYVFSTPPKSMKALSVLENYVNTELSAIEKQPAWRIRLNAYEALETFARNACREDIEFIDEAEEKAADEAAVAAAILVAAATEEQIFSWGMLWENMLASYWPAQNNTPTPNQMTPNKDALEAGSQALIDQINKAGIKSKTTRMTHILNKFQDLTDNFQQHINNCPRIEEDTGIQGKLETLLRDLGEAKNTLKDTGNLEQFRITVNNLFDAFPDDAKFEINGTRTWFQRNVIRPFEQFKQDVHVLFKSIFKRTLGKNMDPPGFFNKPFEAHQKDLEESADYEPPIAEHGTLRPK